MEFLYKSSSNFFYSFCAQLVLFFPFLLITHKIFLFTSIQISLPLSFYIIGSLHKASLIDCIHQKRGAEQKHKSSFLFADFSECLSESLIRQRTLLILSIINGQVYVLFYKNFILRIIFYFLQKVYVYEKIMIK